MPFVLTKYEPSHSPTSRLVHFDPRSTNADRWPQSGGGAGAAGTQLWSFHQLLSSFVSQESALMFAAKSTA